MISIIITAYKEAKSVGKAIDSFLANPLPDYELLVFAPDKETLDVVRKYSKTNKRVKAIKDSGEGKPAALNLAFKQAEGEILIMSDGDVFVDKNAIMPLLENFKNKNVGAISGRPISLNSRKNYLGYWSHLLTDTAHKRRILALKNKKRFYCSGYLYAIRKSLAESIPKETLSDDGYISNLIYNKNYTLAYSPESKVFVKFPTTLTDWINQKRRSAGGYNQIKIWTKTDMRSFSKESSGVFQVLSYPKTIREFFWTVKLIFVRVYLWALIYKDINLSKKEFKKIWVRIDSTK